MVYNVPILEVDESVAKATNTLSSAVEDDLNIINVNPPEQSDGLEGATDFLKSVHYLDINKRLLRSSKNESPVCGMEIWYDDNKIKFMFVTPSEALEQEYRQQINGYYDGGDIASQTSEEGLFVPTYPNKHESVAVTDVYLNKHYFHPISSPDSESDELEGDPYQRLFNEVDTKDNTRVVMQFLYKPAPKSWTELQYRTIETTADKVQNKGGYKTRFFGLKYDEVDDAGIWESEASQMRSRIREPAFFVNMRLAVVARGESQDIANQKAQARMQAILNALDRLYETKAGQGLKPRNYRINKERNARETLVDMIERNPKNMKQETTLRRTLYELLTTQTRSIIMTADELSGLVHLPSHDDVSTGAVSWTEQLVDGQVPPDVDEFETEPEEEQEELEDEVELEDEDEDEDEKPDPSDSRSALFDR